MQRLLTAYALDARYKHRHPGHLFPCACGEGRGGDRGVASGGGHRPTDRAALRDRFLGGARDSPGARRGPRRAKGRRVPRATTQEQESEVQSVSLTPPRAAPDPAPPPRPCAFNTPGSMPREQPVVWQVEDADYEGHSLSMLKRIATALDSRLEIRMVPNRRRPPPAGTPNPPGTSPGAGRELGTCRKS